MSSSTRWASVSPMPMQGAAAQLHAVRPHQPAGVGPLVPGVGGDDGGEERPRRLEVVVVAVHAALGEAPGLVLGEDAGADRHVEAGLARGRAGTSSRMRCMVRSSGPRTASTMQNSEAPSGRGLAGGGEDLVGVEERRGLDRRVEARRLRAEVAVLGAAAGLGRQDALDLDLGPAPGQPDLVGQRGQGHHRRRRAARPARRARRPVRRRRSSSRAVSAAAITALSAALEGDLGRGRRRRRGAADGTVTEGDGARGGHGAHGSGSGVAGRRTVGRRAEKEAAMAWDFSTEPEFEEKLAWMRGFVRRGGLPARDPGSDLRPGARGDPAAAGAR